ncbi:hypothetical protein FF1_016908 [Malus domestica]
MFVSTAKRQPVLKSSQLSTLQFSSNQHEKTPLDSTMEKTPQGWKMFTIFPVASSTEITFSGKAQAANPVPGYIAIYN